MNNEEQANAPASTDRRRVIIEPRAGGGYFAHVPALPGCEGEGKTIEEALAKIQTELARYNLPEEED